MKGRHAVLALSLDLVRLVMELVACVVQKSDTTGTGIATRCARALEMKFVDGTVIMCMPSDIRLVDGNAENSVHTIVMSRFYRRARVRMWFSSKTLFHFVWFEPIFEPNT